MRPFPFKPISAGKSLQFPLFFIKCMSFQLPLVSYVTFQPLGDWYRINKPKYNKLNVDQHLYPNTHLMFIKMCINIFLKCVFKVQVYLTCPLCSAENEALPVLSSRGMRRRSFAFLPSLLWISTSTVKSILPLIPNLQYSITVYH